MAVIGRRMKISSHQVIEALAGSNMRERIRFNDINLRWLYPHVKDSDIKVEDYLDLDTPAQATVKGTDQHPYTFYIARVRNGSTFDDIKRDVPSITMEHIVACFIHGADSGVI